MNKNILLIAAVAVGAVMVLNKAAAQVAPAGSKSAPIQNKNVNDSLHTALLGGAWTYLRDAQNADGTMAFLKKNFLGQTVTSDGKPVSEQLGDMFPVTYGRYLDDVDVSASDGVDYLAKLGGYF